MSWRTIISAAVVVCMVLAGGGRQEGQDAQAAPAPPGPDTVTADIQKNIERHVEEQVRLGGGYFKLRSE